MNKDGQSSSTIKIIPVILCGGIGSRLWPLSREGYPKQFLPLVGDASLFQQTIQRLTPLKDALQFEVVAPIIVTNEVHRFIVLDQLHEISKTADIILEPEGKNTAPSLTLAAMHAQEKYESSILLVLPADHIFSSNKIFCEAITQAILKVIAENNTIVTLGVLPTKAETGYGYIQCDPINHTTNICPVKRFVEKPSLAKAEQYFEQGNYYWNAGIFILDTSIWFDALNVFAPSIYSKTQKAWQSRQFDIPFIRPDKKIFADIPSDSIDYAVMEHCPNEQFSLLMVKLDTQWSDLGSWQSVSEQQVTDGQGNATQGDVVIMDSHNCYVRTNQRLVSILGVQDLVVIDTPDVLLVAHKNNSAMVKTVVTKLRSNDRLEVVNHRKVHRPWGWYDSIDESERFKVKRICVKPKASLSLQKHHHRAEHWIVVKGTAEVTCGNETKLLTENQSTYIPLGEIHRLANPGSIPLEIIEVQSGSYLEEDDIIRLEDNYGRL